MTERTTMLSPAEMAQLAEDTGVAKATSSPLRAFLLGVPGGAFIAFGCVFFITSQVGASVIPWGIAKVIGGLVFSTGLGLVVLTGAELFTSSTLASYAKASRRLTWRQLFTNWTVVYVANFFGTLMIATLVFAGGVWKNADGAWGAVVLNLAAYKVGHTFLEAFMLGILCNLMVCFAVWAGYSGRTATDKIIAIALPIALFVAAGFEHSIANMFLIPLGIAIKDFAGTEFFAAAGLTPSDYDGLTWAAFFADNLLPVTLGNIVGGAVMVGLMHWMVFKVVDRPRASG